ATGSVFRIKHDPAKLLGGAVARSTPPLYGHKWTTEFESIERHWNRRCVGLGRTSAMAASSDQICRSSWWLTARIVASKSTATKNPASYLTPPSVKTFKVRLGTNHLTLHWTLRFAGSTGVTCRTFSRPYNKSLDRSGGKRLSYRAWFG